MKKLSIVVAGVICAASLANASTTGALTKATVKLIKENHQMSLSIQDNQAQITENKNGIEDIKVFYKETKLENEKISKNLNDVKTSISNSNNEIQGLKEKEIALKNKQGQLMSSIKSLQESVSILQKKSIESEGAAKAGQQKNKEILDMNLKDSQKLNALVEKFEKFTSSQMEAMHQLKEELNKKDSQITKLKAKVIELEGEDKIIKDDMSVNNAKLAAEIKYLKNKKPTIVKKVINKDAFLGDSSDEKLIKEFLGN